jgi:hypothetical protein
MYFFSYCAGGAFPNRGLAVPVNRWKITLSAS